MAYQDKLRKLADWLDSHPGIAERVDGPYDYPEISLYAEDSSEFGAICRALGEFDKSAYECSLIASYEAISEDKKDKVRALGERPHHTDFYVSACVSGVCEAKVTAKRERKVYVPVNAYRNADGDLVVEEEIKEWKCPDSWLAL